MADTGSKKDKKTQDAQVLEIQPSPPTVTNGEDETPLTADPSTPHDGSKQTMPTSHTPSSASKLMNRVSTALGVKKLGEGVKEVASSATHGVIGVASSATHGVKNVASTATHGVKGVATNLGDGVKDLSGNVTNVAKKAGQGGFKVVKVAGKTGMSQFHAWRAFITRGNVVDLAVSLVMSTAFTNIVTSLVKNIFSPIIGVATGGVSLNNLTWTIPNTQASLGYGDFVQNIFLFVIISLCMFMVVRAVEVFRKEKPKLNTERECPFCIKNIEKKARRCPYCTSEVEPVEEEETEEEEEEVEEAEQKQPRLKKMMGVFNRKKKEPADESEDHVKAETAVAAK